MGADRKPVDPKRKRQAFSSLFFLLLINYVIQQEKKREEACRLTRFRSALVNTLDSFKINTAIKSVATARLVSRLGFELLRQICASHVFCQRKKTAS